MKYSTILLPALFLYSCIVETNECYTAKIINRNQDTVYIYTYDSLNKEKLLYSIGANSEIEISKFCDEVVSVKLFLEDSLKVVSGTKTEIHYNYAVNSINPQGIFFDNEKNIFDKGWIRTKEKKNKRSHTEILDQYIFD